MAAPAPIACAEAGLRHVFLRDWVLLAAIGVYSHEQGVRQRIRLNVDLGVTDDALAAGLPEGADDVSRVLDYAKLAKRLQQIVSAGHVRLVETLAERLANACLDDGRVQLVRVRVEKLDVLADAVSAGVEIERRRLA